MNEITKMGDAERKAAAALAEFDRKVGCPAYGGGMRHRRQHAVPGTFISSWALEARRATDA